MPRTHSLNRKKDFDVLFKNGQRKFSRYFTAVYAEGDSLRFGLIVKKKNVPLASHRNYSRRIVREILRKEFIPNFQKGRHIAILIKNDLKTIINEAGFENVRKDLINVLRQIR
jgi:ribonuclease P protein component